jgi:hypothetical protein
LGIIVTMGKLLVVMANEPRSYREAIAAALQTLKPNVEVVVVEPEALDLEIERLAPQLVICSGVTHAVETGSLAWVELYPEHDALARVSIGGERSTIAGIELVDILSIVDRTEGLVEAD